MPDFYRRFRLCSVQQESRAPSTLLRYPFSVDINVWNTVADGYLLTDGRPLHFQSISCSHGHHPTRYVYHMIETPSLSSSSLARPNRIELTTSTSVTMWHVPPIVRSQLPWGHSASNPFFFTSTYENYHSIREFCPLSMPIFMYDKDGKYAVKSLEQVCVCVCGLCF